MSSPFITYGGDDDDYDDTSGGGCPPGQEVNWIMIFAVLLLLYVAWIQYTKKTDHFYVDMNKKQDAFKPEDYLNRM
jgi:hypothetical protein